MMKVLFIACSSFSGSTLLSFVLNCHPKITTVGHSVGWRYEEGEEFRCSCGLLLESCAFWTAVAEAFRRKGLPFDFRDFGTRYELVRNDQINRYLTAELPGVRSSRIEALRDATVARMPGWSQTLARQDSANLALIEAALSYAGAQVYVENGHSPYRLRHLSRIKELDISVVHIVRDMRGAVYSYMKNHKWDVETATRIWLAEQANIIRIAGEFEKVKTISYEDFCDRTEETLAGLQEFLGLEPVPYTGDFGQAEHHVLGNAMRLGSKQISKDLRWQTALSSEDREAIVRAGMAAARSDGHDGLAEIVRGYLGAEAEETRSGALT